MQLDDNKTNDDNKIKLRAMFDFGPCSTGLTLGEIKEGVFTEVKNEYQSIPIHDRILYTSYHWPRELYSYVYSTIMKHRYDN